MGFCEDIAGRILILDGAMGTMLQRGLSEEEVLRQYVEAGADIITTNSFNANRISQEDNGLAENAGEMAFEAAVRARKVADSAGRKVYVAGSAGPTGKSLTLPTDARDPAFRKYSFDDFKDAYKEQIEALVKGGVDLILLETCFDALNTKAAIAALEELGTGLPVIISATVSDRSGRTLTGQTLEAFYTSIAHASGLAAFGVNCALGAASMTSLVEDIASFSRHPLIFYPNAGIPDEFGRYDDSPEVISSVMKRLAERGMLNIAGGCCGTTPDHIRAIAEAVRGYEPRIPETSSALTVSGLEAVTIDPSRNFTNIGERTNVAGSRKFARLISGNQYEDALAVAVDQIEGGADIIDINMDDPMVDSSEKMRAFLRYSGGEPGVAKAAVMIDSSHWETILEGLKNAQGKSIVNSISLKDGEDEFIRRAKVIRSFGASMVVMAFDEQGQAVTFDRKVEICARSYRLLTEKAGIPPSDIIFDCNILSIGTGIPEHARFGIDFIEAVRWIKANLQEAKTSGGLSNLSFAFRGNNRVREAMHAAFLYHAIRAGLDMAIVNPQMLRVYDEIEPELRKAVEDVIFDTDTEATARLTAIVSETESGAADPTGAGCMAPDSSADPQERLVSSIISGSTANLEQDVLDCLADMGTAVDVIEGPLMRGMEKVGELFADGRMFLPQVVKSARIMHSAVDILKPYMNGGGAVGARPVIVIATVQGDVHDIGKNITSIVLQCSGFDVVDLGVMVPCDVLLDKAQETGATVIGVSGLITPSLRRMEEICREMAARGMDIPLFVGGAAASQVHTAVKLAPLYANVHYCPDASATAVAAKKYMLSPASFREEEDKKHSHIRDIRESAASSAGRPVISVDGYLDRKVFDDVPLGEVSSRELMPYFDWRMFYAVCRVKGDDPELQRTALEEAEGLSASVCARFVEARRDGDDVVCKVGDSLIRLPMLRDGNSLADFFPETGWSQTGIFAVKVECPGELDIVPFAVRATLAEAASSYLKARFEDLLPDGFKLIMPAPGYACCPDHSLKRDLLGLLPQELGISLTESCAMLPETSICGLVIAHRDAAYTDIRRITPEMAEEYAQRRGFGADERDTFLSHLIK